MYDEPDEVMEQVVKYCIGKSIPCTVREFDSWKYNHDRANITKLPAIHIYRGALYQRTIYLDNNPIDYIDICIQKNKLLEQTIRKRNEAWKKIVRLFGKASPITTEPPLD
jgi:hypothetical protein